MYLTNKDQDILKHHFVIYFEKQKRRFGTNVPKSKNSVYQKSLKLYMKLLHS